MTRPQRIETFEPVASEITIETALENAAAGDYSAILPGDDRASKALNLLLAKLRASAESRLQNTVEASISVNETSVLSANLLYGLRRVDDYSQSIAAAADEMAATVGEISRNGKNIATITLETKSSLGNGITAILSVAGEMGKVAASVSDTHEKLASVQTLTTRISSIAGDIKKIAAQTNLLAINAAVEAARAGDSGKGFAVVANEVKALADRTSSATVEITAIVANLTQGMGSMMEAMQGNTTSVAAGSRAVQDLNEAIGKVEENISKVASNSEDIGIALGQQNEAASSVASGVARIAAHAGRSTEALENLLVTMDKAQNVLSAELTSIGELETPNKLVKLAQSDHVIWKRRLANMIVGREGLKATELSDHHNCRLGKWYDNVTDTRFKGHSAFRALEAPHCRVHQQGIEAVECFNRGDIRGALERINEVDEASLEVLALLRKLEIE